jgi:predicted transcriptional regulator
MTALLEKALEKVRNWPAERQNLAAEILMNMGDNSVYELSDEERAGVEEGIRAADNGEFATDAEVKAVFSKYAV